MNEEDKDLLTDELVIDKNFEKSETARETYESIEELKYPQEYEAGCILMLDVLNEKPMDNPRIEAMFERSRHNNFSSFKFSPDYYELPKGTIRANCKIYQIFKPNSFRDVQKLSQHKTSLNMTFNDLKTLASICRNKRYQLLTIDMTKDKCTGRYCLRLDSPFVPHTNAFQTL